MPVVPISPTCSPQETFRHLGGAFRDRRAEPSACPPCGKENNRSFAGQSAEHRRHLTGRPEGGWAVPHPTSQRICPHLPFGRSAEDIKMRDLRGEIRGNGASPKNR